MENYFDIIMKRCYDEAYFVKKRGPGVPLLNFEGDPGVPLLNFRGIPSPTFKL